MEMVNRRSIPSENRWVPYNDETEQTIVADFKRLWATNFLDDLSIEVRDVRFENGVIGKIIVYNMEERQRVKIVDYIGSDKVDQSKIEEALRDKGIQIRLDTSSIPASSAASRASSASSMPAKGYMFAEVKPTVKEVAGTAEDGARHLQHLRGAEGPHPRPGVRRQREGQRPHARPAR